jgi:dihydroxyacetone kinase
MTDIDVLAARYEEALEAHREDPDDAKKHKASVDAAEKLASTRRKQREADIAAGTRSAGIGIIAEGGDE